MNGPAVDKCAFCGFDLDADDIRAQSPHDHWRHCKDHTNHASYPQLWLLKSELKLPFDEPTKEERICAVCGTPLTQDEWNGVEKTHVNFVCKFHKRAVGDFNIHRTRRNLGYDEFLERPIQSMIKAWGL